MFFHAELKTGEQGAECIIEAPAKKTTPDVHSFVFLGTHGGEHPPPGCAGDAYEARYETASENGASLMRFDAPVSLIQTQIKSKQVKCPPQKPSYRAPLTERSSKLVSDPKTNNFKWANPMIKPQRGNLF